MLYQLSYAREARSVAAESHSFRGWQGAGADPTIAADRRAAVGDP